MEEFNACNQFEIYNNKKKNTFQKSLKANVIQYTVSKLPWHHKKWVHSLQFNSLFLHVESYTLISCDFSMDITIHFSADKRDLSSNIIQIAAGFW